MHILKRAVGQAAERIVDRLPMGLLLFVVAAVVFTRIFVVGVGEHQRKGGFRN